MGARPLAATPRRILVLAGGSVGASQAGPGVRALGLARALAAEFAVTILVPDGAPPPGFAAGDGLAILPMTGAILRREWRRADAVVTHGYVVPLGRILFEPAPLVADLYLPLHVELASRPASRDRWYQLRAARRRIGAVLERADLLVVANARQRDHYLALLRADRPDAAPPPVVIVPTGIDANAADLPTAPRGVPDGRPTFLWNGGIYPWLDAESALAAWQRVDAAGGDAVLEFLGTVPPEEEPELRAHAAAVVRRAAALGLLDRSVVVRPGWRTAAEAAAALAQARAVVSFHREGPEAALAQRTRLVAAIAAGVPILCTRGDAIADLVDARGLGITVAPERPDEIAAAVLRLATDDAFHAQCRAHLAAVRHELDWREVTQPLAAALRTLTPAHRLAPRRAVRLWLTLETLRIADAIRAHGVGETVRRAVSRIADLLLRRPLRQSSSSR